MFDLSLPKLLVLAVIALVIFGPNELPKIAAQLAVYRVFRRVPRELMVADNIHSFSIGDPTIEVHNKQLYDAIVRAVEATFGVKYQASEADRAAG